MEIVEFNSYDKNLIADVIHDRFIDIESVCWNKRENILEILYFSESNLNTPEGKILFYNVIDVNILDEEKVQYYDLNFIKWDEKNNKISLITGITLVFEIMVTKFKIMILKRKNSSGTEVNIGE